MTDYQLNMKPYGNRAILIEWPAVIDERILRDLLAFKHLLSEGATERGVCVKSAYQALLVTYETAIEDFQQEVSHLKSQYAAREPLPSSDFHRWHIPVCYDPKFGVDLQRISEEKRRGIAEIVKLHSGTCYTVYFIGFLPGFMYLGGLPDDLHIPRKANPGLAIDEGAVAIGGAQTGIYPMASPGGWHVIGNSPVNFFNARNDLPCFAQAGDQIQFVSVSSSTHQRIKEEVAAGSYVINKEVLHG